MSATTRRCYLHVGLPKTGTTYLQSVLWQSLPALAEQGLTALPESHRDAYKVMLATQDRLDAEIDALSSDQTLKALASLAAKAPTEHLILSQEQLAGSSVEQAKTLAACFPDFEVHVVVTARSLARQVPSAWQERVKTRKTHAYADFVDAVVDRRPLARSFWRNQGLLSVVHRWEAAVPPERIHVIPIPQESASPNLLLERFCGVIGIDPHRLDTSVTRGNTSLGAVQAELLRRVNLALGDRLPRPRTGYQQVAKPYLVAQVLRNQKSAPPLLPAATERWCRSVTEKWISVLGSGGYDIVGDLGELRPSSVSFSSGEEGVDDDAVSEAAVEALATVLDLRHRELQERRQQDAELRRLRELLADRDPSGPR